MNTPTPNLRKLLTEAAKKIEAANEAGAFGFGESAMREREFVKELRAAAEGLGTIYHATYEGSNNLEVAPDGDYEIFDLWEDTGEPVRVNVFQGLPTLYSVPSSDNDTGCDYFATFEEAQVAAEKFKQKEKELQE